MWHNIDLGSGGGYEPRYGRRGADAFDVAPAKAARRKPPSSSSEYEADENGDEMSACFSTFIGIFVCLLFLVLVMTVTHYVYGSYYEHNHYTNNAPPRSDLWWCQQCTTYNCRAACMVR